MAVLTGDATEPKAELPVARAFRTMRENCPLRMPGRSVLSAVSLSVKIRKPECENTAVG